MIKINLASRKQSAGKDGKTSAAFNLQKIDLSALKQLPLVRIALVGISAYAASSLLEAEKIKRMEEADRELAELSAKGDKLKIEVAKVKSYEKLKKPLEEDEFTLKTKIETIKTLLSNRKNASQLLLSMSSLIPKNVWLEGMRISDKSVEIRGGALDLNLVSDFMKQLGESAYLQNPVLNSSTAGRDGGKETASFDLTVKRRWQKQ